MDFFDLRDEEYETKEFFSSMSLSQSRTLYAIKTNTIQAKMNEMSNPKFCEEMYRCNDCTELCSTEHIKYCSRYAYLRNGVDWSDNIQTVNYFSKILKLREAEKEN